MLCDPEEKCALRFAAEDLAVIMSKGKEHGEQSCFNSDETWNKTLYLFGPDNFIAMVLKH